VNVKVNVELNPELQSDCTDVKVDKPLAIDVREVAKTAITQGTASGGGRPGLASQGGVNAPGSVANSSASASGPKTETEDTTRQEKSVVSSTNTITKRAPLTPRRVTVTVGVLSSYYEKIWEEQHPAAPGTEPKKADANALAQIEADFKKNIQFHVAQLIPLPPRIVDGAPIEVTPMVSVMTFQHIASAPIVPPTIAEKSLSWLNQYWTTLGTLGLGLVSLVVLRSMVRSVSATESPRPAPAVASVSSAFGQTSEGDDALPAEIQEAAAKLKRRVKSGPSMRDELVEIVREDPDAAANILRSWIGSAT
jgi:flagellar M-ring protein FliF